MSNTNNIRTLRELCDAGSRVLRERLPEVLRLAESTDAHEDLDLILRDAALQLAAVGAIGHAEALVLRMRASFEKVETLIGLIGVRESKDGASITAYTAEAEQLVNQNEGDWGRHWQRAELLDKLAQAVERYGDTTRATGIWNRAIELARLGEGAQSPQDSADASSVLGQIAEHLAKTGARSRALEIAGSIRNSGKRERAIKTIQG